MAHFTTISDAVDMIISVSYATSRWLEELGLQPVKSPDEVDGAHFVSLDIVQSDDPGRIASSVRPSMIVGMAADSGRFEALVSSGEALPDVDVVQFDPHTYRETLEMGLELGRRIDRFDAAIELVGSIERELWEAARLAQDKSAHVLQAVVVTSLAPITLMGKWAPGVLEKGGLRPAGPQEGDADHVVSADELRSLKPDGLILALEGLSSDRKIVADALNRAGLDAEELLSSGRCIGLRDPALIREPGPDLVRVVKQLLASRLKRYD